MTKLWKTVCRAESTEDQDVPERVDAYPAAKDDTSQVKDVTADLLTASSLSDDQKKIGGSSEGGENPCTIGASSKELPLEDGLLTSPPSYGKLNPSSKKVAFVSIKNSKISPQSMPGLSPLTAIVNERSDQTENDEGETLASLLTDGIAKDSLF